MSSISEIPAIVILGHKPGPVVLADKSQPALARLARTAHVVELAIQELGTTERYSITGLANELERQTELIIEKGGLTAAQKLQLRCLMSACAAELQAVSVRLQIELLEILLR